MNLKQLRKRAGLSQCALSERLGNTSQGAISQWEKGITSPNIDKMSQIANIFNVSVADIATAAQESKRNCSIPELLEGNEPTGRSGDVCDGEGHSA